MMAARWQMALAGAVKERGGSREEAVGASQRHRTGALGDRHDERCVLCRRLGVLLPRAFRTR